MTNFQQVDGELHQSPAPDIQPQPFTFAHAPPYWRNSQIGKAEVNKHTVLSELWPHVVMYWKVGQCPRSRPRPAKHLQRTFRIELGLRHVISHNIAVSKLLNSAIQHFTQRFRTRISPHRCHFLKKTVSSFQNSRRTNTEVQIFSKQYAFLSIICVTT